MKNHQIGIDISKEKVNICLRGGKKSLWEDETKNTVASIKKALRKGMKDHGISLDDVIVCAEYTGRYIYPLVCSCDELGLFLWMEDPTRIKNSFGIARGKDDKIDARRIAEYADRFSDKAVSYGMPDKTLASIKSKLADRDMLLADRKRYETQLHDQKGFMDSRTTPRRAVSGQLSSRLSTGNWNSLTSNWPSWSPPMKKSATKWICSSRWTASAKG